VERQAGLEADEKHGDQEDQGSEAARSASVGYVSTGPPKLTRVAGQRASEFAPMVVGGSPCESRTSLRKQKHHESSGFNYQKSSSYLLKTESLFILENEAQLLPLKYLENCKKKFPPQYRIIKKSK